MINVLHRTHRPSVAERPLPLAPDFVPPSYDQPSYDQPSYDQPSSLQPSSLQPSSLQPSFLQPSVLPPEPDVGAPPPAPWPVGAKGLVALLAVVAMLATIGAVIVFATRDDGSTERALQEQVVTVTAQRDDALDSIRALDVELATVQQQLDAVQAGNDDLNVSIDELEARITTLTAERTGALATVEELTATAEKLTATIGELTTANDTLEATLASAEQRLAAVTAERDAFAKLFPMKFDATLGAAGTVGTYDVRLSQVFCTGLASCGKAAALDDLTIRMNSQGHLRLTIPKFAEGGLFDADGALHMVADSTTAVPSCGSTIRTARVATTIFPGGYQIAADGARTLTGLNAVITVEAPAVADCPAALAFYGATLTAHA